MTKDNEQLDTESLLLLHVTGELDAQRTAELERRLADDAGLRGQLDQLREAQSLAEWGLGRLDESTPVNEAPAIRRVVSAMRQWQVKSLIPVPAAATNRRPRRLVSRGLAAAAIAATIVLSVTLVYRNMNQPRRGGRPAEIAQISSEQLQQQAAESLAYSDAADLREEIDYEAGYEDPWEISSAEPFFNVPLVYPETPAP